ncbi:MAG: VTT domain-containing protein [Acidimicrobiales bacterium]
MHLLGLLNFTGLVASAGYGAIFVLCVLQSCCVPTSSELTLGFAGALAAQGKLSIAGVIVAGTLGEVVGAYIAWVVGRYAGRAAVDRFGKYLLLSHRDLDRAEAWYDRHRRFGVFGSRLLPVIRNFVALPAGIAEVPLVRFGVLTAAGSLLWDGAWAGIGYGVGVHWRSIASGFGDAGYVLAAVAVVAIAFAVLHRYRSYKDATAGPGSVPVPAGDRVPLLGSIFPTPLAAKVPEVIFAFWVTKILTTAGGEATSDYLRVYGNVKGGAVEVALFALGLALQFGSRRYRAFSYWLLAFAIAIFGTGVSDFLHLDVGIPYAGTTLLWAVVLAVVFWLWQRSEGTLSIHSITTQRREAFYWATVFATFALGTALGDFTATSLHLGYLASGILFGAVILLPALAWWAFGLNAIAAFWMSYVITRPLGASFADYISKSHHLSGIDFGDGPTAIVFAVAVALLVSYLAIARPDIQEPRESSPGRLPSPSRPPSQASSMPRPVLVRRPEPELE